ncbi:Guanine nucleotide-binding protein alpha-2 subunit [Apophysomyces ossiformis]|uniref:Guanine nucleotide-binding protein alpha-2 subunit n=1 Tax=Apophysomyces ossiformis TaxID=679940 RepID=A0A8H7BJE3_9FUNG|nr:Guanine nucleotide-binding protein alpha-2 subunit [Apophysomyces ossiformis]
MGLCLSFEEREARGHSRRIDRIIEKDSKRLKRECKILLLGSGESGKSTIVKQMKIIHQNGYTNDELYAWRATVYKNVVDSAKALVAAVYQFEYMFENSSNNIHAQRIMAYQFGGSPNLPFDPGFVNAIDCVWRDGVVARLLEQESGKFYLMDSAPYQIQRIGKSNYIPDVQDVLRARSKTTGITETRFTMGKTVIHMFDVGGQRSERKKWIHCFEAVTSIIFCVALSEYDQVLLEESRQNRMIESLVLFESVINSRWFLRTSIILFLNKIDLFRSKLANNPLQRYFPDYGGGDDPIKAAKYILWRFNQTNRANLNIYPHLTQATDTSNIRLVFVAIKETTLQNALEDSGIL